MAAEVCHAWRQHLSQPGLPLWQVTPHDPYSACVAMQQRPVRPCPAFCAQSVTGRALMQVASIPESREWSRTDISHLPEFMDLQRWLWRHGSGLLQMHCGTSFRGGVGLHAYVICSLNCFGRTRVNAAMICSCMLCVSISVSEEQASGQTRGLGRRLWPVAHAIRCLQVPPSDRLLAACFTTVACVAPSLQVQLACTGADAVSVLHMRTFQAQRDDIKVLLALAQLS